MDPQANEDDIIRLLQPTNPPPIVFMDLLPTNPMHAKCHSLKKINGQKAYFQACLRQRDIHGLDSLSSNYVSSMASLLWSNEPNGVKQVYINIARQAQEAFQQIYPMYSPRSNQV